MDEYFGQSAKKYKQLPDKYYSLFPALDRHIPTANPGQSLIDLGCGTGDLSLFAKEKNYRYLGVDISHDMLQQAREKYPQVDLIEADITQAIHIDDTFDIVLCNMLVPSLAKVEQLRTLLKNAFTLLKGTGLLIITSGHPCYDGYMQKKLFSREDIETNFEGYFNSGANYIVHRHVGNESFAFSDYHRTLTDYFVIAEQSGFSISMIDECPLTPDAPPEIVEKMTKRGCPNYIVLILKKKTAS